MCKQEQSGRRGHGELVALVALVAGAREWGAAAAAAGKPPRHRQDSPPAAACVVARPRPSVEMKRVTCQRVPASAKKKWEQLLHFLYFLTIFERVFLCNVEYFVVFFVYFFVFRRTFFIAAPFLHRTTMMCCGQRQAEASTYSCFRTATAVQCVQPGLPRVGPARQHLRCCGVKRRRKR